MKNKLILASLQGKISHFHLVYNKCNTIINRLMYQNNKNFNKSE